MTTDTKSAPCPYCDAPLECATSVRPGDRPDPGSIAVCWECGEILILDADLQAVKPTAAQLIAMQRGPYWRQVEKLATAVKQRKAG